MSKTAKKLDDFFLSQIPVCLHCDVELPDSSVVEEAANILHVRCPNCGLLNVFKITASNL